MQRSFKRTDRVSQLLQRNLATIIQTELKDPRLPDFITVSDVEVTSDLAHAKVYVTMIGNDEPNNQNLLILNQASAYIRKLLAQSVKLRIVPNLHFLYDKSIEHGAKLSRIIEQLPDTADDDD